MGKKIQTARISVQSPYFLPHIILFGNYWQLMLKYQGRIYDKPVTGGWAGAVTSWAGAAMYWAGAVMIWAGAC